MSANQEGLGICIWWKSPTRRVQRTGTMLRKSPWVGTFIFHLGTDLLLRPGGRVQFFKRLDFFWGGGGNFENAQNVRGVEILSHRTGRLCKSCQTILWLKQIYVSFKSRQKIRFGGSLSATKCYPYKAWPRNLSAISPTRDLVCMYAHLPMHTAELWKNI